MDVHQRRRTRLDPTTSNYHQQHQPHQQQLQHQQYLDHTHDSSITDATVIPAAESAASWSSSTSDPSAPLTWPHHHHHHQQQQQQQQPQHSYAQAPTLQYLYSSSSYARSTSGASTTTTTFLDTSNVMFSLPQTLPTYRNDDGVFAIDLGDQQLPGTSASSHGSSVSPLQRRTVFVLLFAVFIDLLSVGLVVPLLPYYASNLGASSATIGLLGSFYGVLQLIGSPMMGMIADKYGRKSALGLSLIGTIVSYLSITMATSIPLLFLSRIPVGLMKQTMSIAQAVVSDVSTPRERGQFLGYVSTAVSLGFIAGPALGGLISSYGLQYPAYISSILLTIDVLFISLLLPNITPSPKSAAVVASSDTPSESAASAVKRSLSRLEAAKAYLGKISQFGHGVMLVYILHFLACLADTLSRSSFQQFTIVRYSLTPQENGFIMAYMSLLQVFAQGVLIGPLNRYFSDSQLIGWGSLCHSLAALLLMQSMGIYGAMASLIPLVWGSGIVGTCITSAATKMVAVNELGTTLGMLGSIGSVVRIVAPYIGGILMDSIFGASAPSGVVAMLAAVVFVLLQVVPLSPTTSSIPEL